MLFFRDFRYIWFSGIAGLFVRNMQIMARGWVIYDITGSAMDLTWVWVILTHSPQATSLLPMSQKLLMIDQSIITIICK